MRSAIGSMRSSSRNRATRCSSRRSNRLVLFIHSTVEIFAFPFEPPLVRACALGMPLIAAARAAQRSQQRGQQQQGQVRLNSIANRLVQRENALRSKAAARALVSLRTVGVPVAEHDGPFGKRGKDDFAQGLSAICEHERHLSFGGNAAHLGVTARIKQDGPDPVAKGGASRLAKGAHRPSLALQAGRKQAQLRGLTRAVKSLEGDEETVSACGHLCGHRPECKTSSLPSYCKRRPSHG